MPGEVPGPTPDALEGGRISNVEEAEEMAYAEKPTREWLAENKDKLSPEQRQALEWFASAGGEKALGNFRAQKERARDLVHQKAQSLFEFNQPQISGFATSYRGDRLQSNQIKRFNRIVLDVEKSEIESTLASNLKPTQKLESLRAVAENLAIGARDADTTWQEDRNPPGEVERILKRYLRENPDTKDVPYHYLLKNVLEQLKGFVVYSLVRGDGVLFKYALDGISRATSWPKNPAPELSHMEAELLERVASYVAEVVSDREVKEEQRGVFNSVMGKKGYLLDRQANKYQRVE